MKTETRSLLIVGLVVVAGLVASTGFYYYFSSSKNQQLAHFWSQYEQQQKPGLTLRGNLSYKNTSNQNPSTILKQSSNSSVSSNQPEISELLIKSAFEKTLLNKNSHELTWIMRFQIAQVHFVFNHQQQESLQQNLTLLFQHPIVVTESLAGGIKSIKINDKSNVFFEGIIKHLLTLMQLSRPQHENNPYSWLTSEEDPNGVYQVQYQVLSLQGSGLNMSKSNKQYTFTGTTSHMPPAAHQPRYLGELNIQYELDTKDFFLKKISGSERLDISLEGDNLGNSVTELEAHIALTSAKNDLNDLNMAAQSPILRTIPLTSNLIAQHKNPATLTEQQKTMQMTATIQALDQLENIPTDHAKQNQLLSDLRNQLTYHADIIVEKLIEHLLVHSAKDPLYTELAGLLIYEGSAQSQKGLISLINQSKDLERKASFISYLGLFTDPTNNVIEVLKLHAEDPIEGIAFTALLALGNAADWLGQKNDSTQSKAIIDYLQGRYEQDHISENEKIALVDSMGNTKSSTILKNVKEDYPSGSEDLKKSFLHALRFVETPEAEEFLLGSYQNEASPNIRKEAIIAFNYRSPSASAIKALMSAVGKDKSVQIRATLINTLARFKGEHPQILQLLKEIAANDPDLQVREIAKSFQ